MLNDRIILQKGATTFHSNIDEGFTALVFDTTYHTLEPLTIRIHSLEEAVEAGITTELLCGIPYYHIRQFYEWTDDERPLTVALLPCSDEEGNPDFSNSSNCNKITTGYLPNGDMDGTRGSSYGDSPCR